MESVFKKILIAPIPVVHNKTVQAVILKSMISDPGWFYSNQIKFEDWQKEI